MANERHAKWRPADLFTGHLVWVVNNSGSDFAICLGNLRFVERLSHQIGQLSGEPVSKSPRIAANACRTAIYRHSGVVNKWLRVKACTAAFWRNWKRVESRSGAVV